MEFCGVVASTNNLDLESDATKLPRRIIEVLSACHSLVFVDNKLVGDPKAALKGKDGIYTSDEKAMPKKSSGNAVQIVHRYQFASHFKRMSVVVRIQEEFFAFVKGAPETIQERLINLLSQYVKTYKTYTRQGSRVLALAYKPLPEMARDWNEELKSCQEFPHKNLQERILRDRALYKLCCGHGPWIYIQGSNAKY